MFKVVAGLEKGAEREAHLTAMNLGLEHSGLLQAKCKVIGETLDPKEARAMGVVESSHKFMSGRTKAMLRRSDVAVFFGKGTLNTAKNLIDHTKVVGIPAVVAPVPRYLSQKMVNSVAIEISRHLFRIFIRDKRVPSLYVSGDRDDRHPQVNEWTRKVLEEAAKVYTNLLEVKELAESTETRGCSVPGCENEVQFRMSLLFKDKWLPMMPRAELPIDVHLCEFHRTVLESQPLQLGEEELAGVVQVLKDQYGVLLPDTDTMKATFRPTGFDYSITPEEGDPRLD